MPGSGHRVRVPDPIYHRGAQTACSSPPYGTGERDGTPRGCTALPLGKGLGEEQSKVQSKVPRKGTSHVRCKVPCEDPAARGAAQRPRCVKPGFLQAGEQHGGGAAPGKRHSPLQPRWVPGSWPTRGIPMNEQEQPLPAPCSGKQRCREASTAYRVGKAPRYHHDGQQPKARRLQSCIPAPSCLPAPSSLFMALICF